MAARFLTVPDGLAGERIDIALTRMLGLSRSRAVDIISLGAVTLDGSPAMKSDRLLAGSVIEIDTEVGLEPVAMEIDTEPVPGLRVVFDDDDFVVVDKPVGVAAHPSPGWTGPTVVGGLIGAGYGVSTSGAAERQGIVHRLDVGTTGLMVVAKSESAYTSLKHQFKERTVEKVYHAIAQGLLDPLKGTIEAPIGRHPQADYKFAVVEGGKHSVTHYETLEAFNHGCLVEVHLETGRTHQIRVHMAAMRHPLAGDITYGADPVLSKKVGLTRQWLHAMRLGFHHPSTGEYVEFESRYPADLEAALEQFRQGA